MVITPWLLLACDGLRPGHDSAGGTGWSRDSDTSMALPDSWEGIEPGAGLGFSLVSGDGGAWAAAPWGATGSLWRLGADLSPVMDEHALASLGFSLARSDSGVLAAGAPLAEGDQGKVLRSDEDLPVLEGPVVGGRVAWDGSSLWAIGTQTLWRQGVEEALPSRAGALVSWDGAAVVGLPRGADAIWVEGVGWSRAKDGDEAGAALCVADLDGDGREDLAIGAPGADRVYVLLSDQDSLGERVIEGPGGRFGQALACGPQTLAIGAPWAEGGVGAVWLLESPAQIDTAGDPVLVGQEVGDQLGAALAMGPANLWVGVPGAAAGAGRVERLSR